MKLISCVALLFVSTTIAAPLENLPQLDAISSRIRDHARLAMAAYGDPQTNCTFPGFQVITSFDSDLDQGGYIALLPSRREVVIVFRGSSSVENYAADLAIKPLPFDLPGCTVNCSAHAGSLANFVSAQAATQGFRQALSAAAESQYQIAIIGHSLGAAVASIAALGFIAARVPIVLSTFGQFRTVSPNAAKLLSSLGNNAARTVHDLDIVPGLIAESDDYSHWSPSYFMGDLPFDAPLIMPCLSQDGFPCSGGLSIKDHSHYVVQTGSC
ncbi:uncharacterized protein L969DRAFT_90716 [Mixia osmundae IAM 14324]|uniref:Fungal lipase-type domain-containing protein n=1 Tax=Mixia osmundae (strain CBS 9802 / IAM 14324 / JCM 22182 / KY 12970) TaxID=764103 RepID=G7E1T2_MIXOS|nr:uncharacterized protein L969DRAFT_90716 [Mixia osmundae IAM 14324]KEI36741.1 hypothetical protein L969DRAFT_90716 [Mixia osmundae IAM 14324]GAA96792.1 hypothetical protein E5Q_03463 [Mixia osmundae IAM 14324]